jgi:DNA-binding response OmpR family regulator
MTSLMPRASRPTASSRSSAAGRLSAVSPAEQPILVVDDDRKIVALLRAYLEREGYPVIAAHDGAEALRRSRERQPALIVLDRMLPELDGIDVLRAIRREGEMPVLMLSARGTVPDRIRGIEHGADDYLPKPFSPAELVARVKAILRRSRPTPARPPRSATSPASTRTLRQADLVIDLDRHEVRRGDVLILLTHVEFRLLAALVAADGRVLSRDQLLDAVYGPGDGDVLDRTIDVHVGRLRDKLGDDADHPRYVATVRGTGYRAAPPARR